jgi:hypothetical protein
MGNTWTVIGTAHNGSRTHLYGGDSFLLALINFYTERKAYCYVEIRWSKP